MKRNGVHYLSYCPMLNGAYHHWYVTHHTSDWKRLKCYCSRCGRHSWMDAREYREVNELAEHWWQAYLVERNLGSTPARAERN